MQPLLTRTACGFSRFLKSFYALMNAMPPSDLGPQGLQDPYALFSTLVQVGGKVLITSEDHRDALLRLGYGIEKPVRDLRMMGGAPETLDAIWWSRANENYSIEDAFRIFQSLFRALKPKQGILAVSFLRTSADHPWNTRTVMTLLRQSGFLLFHTLENPQEHLYFGQRI